MDASDRGQVSANAAEIYDAQFVPALFREWTAPILATARLRPGDTVLDVACGTGVLARDAVDVVGASAVTGVDINPGMLAVARRRSPEIVWRAAAAEALPFSDASFDAVLCQFGLMFFADRVQALREMRRVARPGGAIVLAVWESLERSPGYRALTDLLAQRFGESVARCLYPPFNLGDMDALRALLREADLEEVEVATHVGRASFPSLQAWIRVEVTGWTLDSVIDDRQLASLCATAEESLKQFVAPDGRVVFDSPAHIVSARRPE
jgi:ubiquinone/menaquinone biosynthesis C-methylase UbiE